MTSWRAFERVLTGVPLAPKHVPPPFRANTRSSVIDSPSPVVPRPPILLGHTVHLRFFFLPPTFLFLSLFFYPFLSLFYLALSQYYFARVTRQTCHRSHEAPAPSKKSCFAPSVSLSYLRTCLFFPSVRRAWSLTAATSPLPPTVSWHQGMKHQAYLKNLKERQSRPGPACWRLGYTWSICPEVHKADRNKNAIYTFKGDTVTTIFQHTCLFQSACIHMTGYHVTKFWNITLRWPFHSVLNNFDTFRRIKRNHLGRYT